MNKRFDKLDAVLLAACALATGLYLFARATGFYLIPGLGGTVSFLLLFALAAWSLWRRGRLALSKEALFLSALSLLLSLPFALFGDMPLLLLNLPVLAITAVQALLSLAGKKARLTVRGMLDGASTFLTGIFRHVFVPFQAFHRRGRTLALVLGGLVIGLPLIAVMVALLSSADMVFDSWITEALRSLERFDPALFGRVILLIIATFLLFSFLYGLGEEQRPLSSSAPLRLPAALFSLSLTVLAAFYALFAYLQFRFLFAGSDSSLLPHGATYSAYARQGFFQLVAVSFVTLSLVLFTLHVAPAPYDRALCAVLSLLTVVIAVSAGWRMVLYVRAYGLTLLRVLTLWGIVMLILGLLLAAFKSLLLSFALGPALLCVWLVGWTALQFANVDAHIAHYNVRAYQRGEVRTLDIGYLSSLSPAVLRAFDDEQLASERETLIRYLRDRQPQGWYDLSAIWKKLP